MVKGRSAIARCAICSDTRRKFPASWVMDGDSAFCANCWDNVQCARCGHHDPKGEFAKGRWACRACRHKSKTKANGSFYEDCHRTIIQDCNGGLAYASDQAEGEKGGNNNREDESFENEEVKDQLAPLPLQKFANQISRACRKASADPCHVIMLIDTSGSMRSEDVITDDQNDQPDVVCRLAAATKCASEFAEAHWRQNSRDRFSVVTFGDTASIEGEVMDITSIQEVLGGLRVRGMGGTSFLAALTTASRLIHNQATMRTHMVLLSDGRPADTKAALKFFQAEFLHGKCGGTHVHGIGFGATVQSFAPLQQLACLSGGSFVLSTCSIQGLSQAFSSVSSTITSLSSGCFNEHGQGSLKHVVRPVMYEQPEISEFGRHDVLRFHAIRSAFQYDGKQFQSESCGPKAVARRLRPFMRGGMRLVYGFRDEDITKDDGSGNLMVAKASRFLDEICNRRSVVESHAKSTAVAHYYASRFNARLASANCQGKRPGIFFVPCYVYDVVESDMINEDEARIFAAERFLPGAFLKYNSNNGFVSDSSVRHHDVVQAFTHFSFKDSGGKHAVADLQGVARDSEVLLTDPQVLSLDGIFGPGDLGVKGIKNCLAAHRCGPTCKKLGLEPLTAATIRRFSTVDIDSRPRARGGFPPRIGSTFSNSDWEKISDADGNEEWQELKTSQLEEYAMSDGTRSQGSSCSWVHVLDM